MNSFRAGSGSFGGESKSTRNFSPNLSLFANKCICFWIVHDDRDPCMKIKYIPTDLHFMRTYVQEDLFFGLATDTDDTIVLKSGSRKFFNLSFEKFFSPWRLISIFLQHFGVTDWMILCGCCWLRLSNVYLNELTTFEKSITLQAGQKKWK